MPENKQNGRNYTIILQRNITALNTSCCYLHEKKHKTKNKQHFKFYFINIQKILQQQLRYGIYLVLLFQYHQQINGVEEIRKFSASF